MSAEDRYDARGRVLDGPDDPSCCHGNDPDTCAECIAEWKREIAIEEAWAREHLPPPDALADLEDLPY